MSSQFRLSHLSLAFIATLSSPALLAQSVEKERDKVPIQATDLPVDGTPQALVLGETPAWYHYAWMALVFGGILLTTRKPTPALAVSPAR